ncbi:interactor of constitutive active ROPs 4-like [Macadamia integrifolia]|uniref:interactor of constitutive active ROPs 4-like n=1 Tax=Macadamia integrifolia TaxID=60698 RepID=UPI001C52C7AF|nr:interactor of constitutive active ROPs 4-like [Macadamia integrifolia]
MKRDGFSVVALKLVMDGCGFPIQSDWHDGTVLRVGVAPGPGQSLRGPLPQSRCSLTAVVDLRSPPSSQHDSLQQKKLGTRIADFESQLGQAQEELKKLKDQLAHAEAEKKTQKSIVPETSKEEDKSTDRRLGTWKSQLKLKLHPTTMAPGEQWRKAEDAAVAILSGGVEMNVPSATERCVSMDEHRRSCFGAADGSGRFVGSPLLADDLDNGFGSGKRKGAGMRMFGDLCKRKGQK